jgi:acyl-CoA reductase-like NAD-dependent aldehyde dehydrogenase
MKAMQPYPGEQFAGSSAVIVADGNPDPAGDSIADAIAEMLARGRVAQQGWRQVPVRMRVRKIADFRARMASDPAGLAAPAAGEGHPVHEVLVAEMLPLLEACRFLEKCAAAILAERKVGRMGGPVWMGNVSSVVVREPLGVVGVISPGNYPLFLGAVQVLQAITAGNAVLWKPAPGCAEVAHAAVREMAAAGFPADLVQVVGDSDAWGSALTAAALDKLIFTGSHSTGARVLKALSSRAVPSVMELSGCDAVFVRADADLDLVTRALRFGLLFNQSRTCIAPRRVYIAEELKRSFLERMSATLANQTTGFACQEDSARLRLLFEKASHRGARFLCGGLFPDGQRVLLPAVIEADAKTAEIFHGDFFLPLLTLVFVQSEEEALCLDLACPYALGASVFSRDTKAAAAFAQRLRAGSVVINDLIAPTADPRLPFGGTGASGFGSTRGPEGLLEMSRPKVIQIRRDAAPAHLANEQPSVALLVALTRLLHGAGFTNRLRAFGSLCAEAWRGFFSRARFRERGREHAVSFNNPTHRAL